MRYQGWIPSLTLAAVSVVQSCWTVPTQPIHDAVKNGDIVRVEKLIRQGANLEAPSHPLVHLAVDSSTKKPWYGGQTPLVLAAKSYRTDLVTLLLKYGANIDANDGNEPEEGMTALHFAAMHRDMRMGRVLVEAGANLNLACSHGWTPLAYALGWGEYGHRTAHQPNDEFAMMLLDRGAKPDAGALIAALHNREERVLGRLLELGADVNGRCQDGSYPLLAARNQSQFDLLVDKGAGFQSVDSETASQYILAAQLAQRFCIHHATTGQWDRARDYCSIAAESWATAAAACKLAVDRSEANRKKYERTSKALFAAEMALSISALGTALVDDPLTVAARHARRGSSSAYDVIESSSTKMAGDFDAKSEQCRAALDCLTLGSPSSAVLECLHAHFQLPDEPGESSSNP